jgi:hypothetical protein
MLLEMDMSVLTERNAIGLPLHVAAPIGYYFEPGHERVM